MVYIHITMYMPYTFTCHHINGVYTSCGVRCVLEPIVSLSSMFCIPQRQVGSLKSTTLEIFVPWKLINATNQDFLFLESKLLNTPTAPPCHGPDYWVWLRRQCFLWTHPVIAMCSRDESAQQTHTTQGLNIWNTEYQRWWGMWGIQNATWGWFPEEFWSCCLVTKGKWRLIRGEKGRSYRRDEWHIQK